MNNNRKPYKSLSLVRLRHCSFFFLICGIIALFLISSCENDLEVVKSFNDTDKIPSATVEKSEIMYYDSSELKVKIESDLLQRFTMLKSPYIDFPKGIHVFFYDNAKRVKAEVKSKYAMYKEKEEIWEARNDVVVISQDGKKLNTEQLFWDRNKKIIYSDKFCRISTPTANLTGNKFVASEDFSTYELSSVQGPLKVRDEE